MLEEKLNEFNIFALRDFARRTGVVSPTSKKKDVLIKEIMEILSGQKQPLDVKTKQGRPPKTFGYNFSNLFNEVGNTSLKQNVEEFKDDDIITVAGWVELVNGNSALLWVVKDFKIENYFISKEVIKDYEVKHGDRVVAEVEAGENGKVIKRIFSINDYPIMKLPEQRVDYSEIFHNVPNRKLKFKSKSFQNLNLYIGENVYIYGKNNNQNTSVAVDIMNDSEIENKIYINISIAEKNKIYLSNLKHSENFLANITDDVNIVRRMIMLAVERAKRILEKGEDVLIVVDDVSSIFGVDKDELNLVKNLISITKEGNENGSITILAVMPNEQTNQIEKLADKRLKIENGNSQILN